MESASRFGVANVKLSHSVLGKARQRKILAFRHRLVAAASSSSNEDRISAPPNPVYGDPETATSHGATPGVAKRPPPPPIQNTSQSGSHWIWMGVGAAIAIGTLKLIEFIKTAPQRIQQALMQQMLKQMTAGAAGSPGAVPPNPFAQFGGMPTGPTTSASPTMPPSSSPISQPSQPVIDIMANQNMENSTQSGFTDKASKHTAEKASPAKSNSTESPSKNSSVSSSSLFKDVDAKVVEEEGRKDMQNAAAFKSENGNVDFSGAAASNFFAGQAGPNVSNAQGGEAQNPMPGIDISMDQLQKMMENPEIQKMVYPYLPEEMRNPDTFKWIMTNPAYRSQMEIMLSKMKSGDPEVMNMMKDFNSGESQSQFEALGMKPEEVMSKIMSDPTLASAFANPRIQAAIMECSQNPMSMMKYQDDKEIMEVFNKIQNLFPEQAGFPMQSPPTRSPSGSA